MPSTCSFPTATSSSVAPIAPLAAPPLSDPLVPASQRPRAVAASASDPLAAPPRARFRRLVVFDGRLA